MIYSRSGSPKVVIVGGGFAGIQAAKALSGSAADVLVIDQHNHHCFQPLLYQVATATLSPADVAWPIRSILRRQANARVLLARVDGIDPAARLLTAGGAAIPYDYLVIAVGVRHSYFGHDEWAPAAPGLKQISDATDIRRRLLFAFERAEYAGPSEAAEWLTFVIVGGGPTGVEMAGAIAEVARHTLISDFRNIDPSAARIVLVEAGDRILSHLPQKLSDYAKLTLKRMGVEVRTGQRVTGCDAAGVFLGSTRLAARTIIWAAGVKAPDVGTWLGAACDGLGRIVVNPDLSVPGQADTFAAGDIAAASMEDGRPVPGLAPAAKQMGRYVGNLVAARISGAERGPAPFRYRHQGDLATIGRKSAVVHFGSWQLSGFPAWLFWSLVHILFLVDNRTRLSVALNWLWSYLTLRRGARLIIGEPPAADALAPPGEAGLPARSATSMLSPL